MFEHESAHPKISFYHSDTWIYDGILMIQLQPELVIDLNLALQMQSDWHTLQNDAKKTVLDLNDLIYIEPSARTLCVTTHELLPANMIAIYARSKFLQMIGRAFKVIDCPPYRVGIFSDLNKALVWLKQ